MASGEGFYHDVSLRGPVPDRLLVRLPRLRAPDPDLATRICAVAARDARGFFAPDAASFAYAQSFAWTWPLASAEEAEPGTPRHAAGALFEAWMRDHGRYAPRAWAPVLAAQRTEAMLANAPLLLEGRDAPVREQVFATLIRQTRHLAKAARRAPPEGRLAAACGLMLGTLALPGADAAERAGKAALTAALDEAAAGRLPDGLRRPGRATSLAATLLGVSAAYKARGLTPPPTLGDAIGALRLLMGGLCLPGADALAVLPGGGEGDGALLGALRPLRRPEADAMLDRYGYARLTAGGTALHVDGATGGFALSDGAARVVTAAGAPGPGLRAVSARMEDWHAALSRPAGGATLDAGGYGPGSLTRTDAPEGSVIAMRRRGPDGGAHERRLFLPADGAALLGEDAAHPGATYRFPLHPDTEARPAGPGRIGLVLPSGRSWRLEAANADVSVEEGIYSGGHAPRASAQVVVVSEREGVRWAIKRA